MLPSLEQAPLPTDAVEVGRILDAWGIKGWFKVLPHSASPEALFSSKHWFLLPSEHGAKRVRPTDAGTIDEERQSWLLHVHAVKAHSDSVVASSTDITDRDAAQGLKGARIFVPRSAFPALKQDEYYWVDLIGHRVINREGIVLGEVHDLMTTGAQTVLVLEAMEGDKKMERMIPFVSAFVDKVDAVGRCITVDWQADF